MTPTVVILLSDKRSGSTMFQDELCRHSDIQTVAYSPHRYLETHHWLKGTVLLDRPAKRESRGGIYAGYGSKDNARAYTVDLLEKNLPGYKTPASDRELVFHGWEALCGQFARPVFFEKSPQYLGFPASLDLIREWLGQTRFRVKFIGLTRNPLGVQYSAWKLFHRDPSDRQYGWKTLQEELLDFAAALGPDQYLHVRYEDIIADATGTFAQICRFIGVTPDQRLGQEVHPHSLTKWKDDPYFTVRLDESVKVLARQFGYVDEELDNPLKPKPPWWWRARTRVRGSTVLFLARLRDRFIKPARMRFLRRGTVR